MSAEPWSIRLSVDERYPFVHESEHGVEVRFGTPEEITRWRRVMAEFEVVQKEMEAAYDRAQQAKRREERLARARAVVEEAEREVARQEHLAAYPPSEAASWRAPRDCWGPAYVSERAAWLVRRDTYELVSGDGEALPFDIAPYRCVEGHWHLGKAA